MANNILLISWISEAYWSYNYLLVIILLLIISILLYRIRKLQKTIKKTNHSYRFSFDILDNLPFPIFVKDITNDFRYYYWNKESAVQSAGCHWHTWNKSGWPFVPNGTGCHHCKAFCGCRSVRSNAVPRSVP